MENIFDVIIIGAGPAGMIAAGKAGSLGKKVLLLEKNPNIGKKLLITGGGRCNVTNTSTDLVKIYKESGRLLQSTFNIFGVQDTLELFQKYGLETKEEEHGRIFPKTNKSQSVLDVLIKYMKDGNVEIRCNSTVLSIQKIDEIFNIELSNGELLKSKSCIISTGGISHPETGSTGDGFKWLESLGHKIIQNDFALVPLSLSDDWAKKISGTAFDDIKITVLCDKERVFSSKGRILFTHFGISGPTILNMSKKIGELLHTGEVTLSLDFYPTTDIGSLRNKLNEILNKESNKMLRTSLSAIIPKSLIPAVLSIGNINPNLFNHSVTREIRYKIIDLIKNLPLHVISLMGADKAIVSSGGVDINEVDFTKMESKTVKNLFLVGDVLNIDRPSGGYSLQLCWTTGYVAGNSC